MTTHFFNTEDTLVTLNGVHILLLHMILFSLHIVRIVYVFRVFVIVTQCNNLIAENKIIITTSDSFHV